MDPNPASLGEAPKNSLQQHSPEVTSLPIGKKRCLLDVQERGTPVLPHGGGNHGLMVPLKLAM
jgi:hypothetical protein